MPYVMNVQDPGQPKPGAVVLMDALPTTGGRVPLHVLADVADADGPGQIYRDKGLRRVAVLANTDGSDMEAITQRILTPLPAG